MKGLLLLSAGIDSPVAAHMMQQQGMELAAIHFHSYPVSDLATVEKSKQLCAQLGIATLYIVPFANIQAEVVKQCNNRFYYVITRRLMYKIAEHIAHRDGFNSLVTGENLGQVASQTLDNMSIIDRYLKIPVHRPLLTYNKQEIIEVAKGIDTYEISKGPEVCCMLGPKDPITRANLAKVETEECHLDVPALLSATIEKMECAVL